MLLYAAGYLRNYASVLPVMSHAYNFQIDAYGFTDTTRKADNQASQADVAVDPVLQVKGAPVCVLAASSPFSNGTPCAVDSLLPKGRFDDSSRAATEASYILHVI